MATVEQLRKVATGNTMVLEVASKYLTTYVGSADWERHIGIMHGRLQKKGKVDELRNAVAFAVLLPAHDRSTRIDPEHPENLLYHGMSFQQYPTKDWFAALQDVIKRDIEIDGWRKQALSRGVIDPIEYQPFCRQAYNWVYGKAVDTGAVTEDNKQELSRRFRNLVLAYGGAVISYLFTNHATRVAKVLNWRSGYFIERAIFDAYTIEQVIKIKDAELERTNDKLVKTLKLGA